MTTRDTILQCRTVPLNSGALGTLKRTPTQPLTELYMSAPGIHVFPLATFSHLLLLNREEVVCGTEEWLSEALPTYSPVDRIEVYCSNNERSAYNATRGSSLSLKDYYSQPSCWTRQGLGHCRPFLRRPRRRHPIGARQPVVPRL